MAKVVCTKCGLTGDSKNPWTRSIFTERTPRGYLDTTFSYVMAIHEEEGNVTISFSFYEADGPKGLEIIKEMLNHEGFDSKVHGCIHEWDMAPGAEPEV